VITVSTTATPVLEPVPLPVPAVHALLPSLKARLGALIGPRPSSAPAPNQELP
jgi:hypothetical protein